MSTINARVKVSRGDVDTWTFDFSQWLAAKTEEMGASVTLVTATWSATDGLTVLGAPDYPDPAIFDEGRQVRVWWDAGELTGTQPVLTCAIVTSAGHERTASVAFDAR